MVRALLAPAALAALAAGCVSTPDAASSHTQFAADATDARCGRVGRLVSLLPLVDRCAVKPDAAPKARLAKDVTFDLPTPPAYPEATTIVQTGRARYGDHQAAFEAVLSLAPERAEIVLTMLGGPRLSTITWDETGIYEDRTLFAPRDVPVENIVADIFFTVWPAETVASALPPGLTLTVDEDGSRTIWRDGEMLVSSTPTAGGDDRTVVRNIAYGYEVALVSQSLE
jgi:hypothetical protein